MFGNKQNNKDRQNPDLQNSNNTKKKINWDAETVDYEEVKETKDKR